MEYKDFQLVASGVEVVKKAGKKLVTFRVQVTHTPDGRTLVKGIPVQYDANELRQLLQNWEERELAWEDVMQVGLWLGNVLFPAEVRKLLEENVNLAKGYGLRLRLLLQNELQNVPWEYVLLNRGGGEATSTDFLGLMPNVSIVRHQEAGVPAWDVKAKLPTKVIVALANVSDYPQLDLEEECGAIEQALQGNPHLTMIPIEPAHEDLMQDKKLQAHLFHFAGHADFQAKVIPQPGAVEGTGVIIVDDGYGDPKPLPGDQLALRLRQAGVRVAVLGACRSGRRGDVNVWSSVAGALLKAELGAVVAMQYRIRDKSAIAFAKELYGALATGLPIDEAVTTGRVAVAGSDDVRGWGVPVLYLQTWDGVIFPEQAADATLQQERDGLLVRARQRIKELHGKAVTVKIGKMTEGQVEAEADIDVVKKGAKSTVVEIDELGGGTVSAKQKIKKVGKGGSATGVSLGTLGKAPQKPDAASRTCPHCHQVVEPDWKFCAYCRTPLKSGE